jgi:predicted DNA-binding protein (MmcQ/YjbR family)
MSPVNANQMALRDFALRYPETHEDFPWGERVIKVKGKVFLFLGGKGQDLSLSVKLPSSGLTALGLPFASPTAYGLAKSGWVTARFSPKEKPPLEVLRSWIDESYRAVAPKKLVAALGDGAPAATAPLARKATARAKAAAAPRRAAARAFASRTKRR